MSNLTDLYNKSLTIRYPYEKIYLGQYVKVIGHKKIEDSFRYNMSYLPIGSIFKIAHIHTAPRPCNDCEYNGRCIVLDYATPDDWRVLCYYDYKIVKE
jgi:hypothetical protein